MAGEVFLSNLTGQFDAAAFVERLMQAKYRRLESLAQQSAVAQAKKEAVDELLQAVDSFESSIRELDIERIFDSVKATSSEPDVLTAAAEKGAPELSFRVTVNSLSQKEMRLTSAGVSGLGTSLSAASFTLRVNISPDTYEEYTIDFSGGTIEDLVATINDAQDKVEASIYYDGSGYRLLLSEKEEGLSSVETDTEAGTYAMEISAGALPTELGELSETLQSARNAEIQIGTGAPIESPTNTFEEVISGVDLTVKGTGSAEVEIKEDYSGVSSFLQTFVEHYNKVVETINKLTDKDTGILLGQNFVTLLESNLSDLLTPLAEKGLINMDDAGKISVNSENLEKLLEEPSEAQEMLGRMKEGYQKYLDWQTNFLESISRQYEQEITRLEERAMTISEALEREKKTLLLRYSRLEAFMNQANGIIKRLQDYIVTLSQMSGGNKK